MTHPKAPFNWRLRMCVDVVRLLSGGGGGSRTLPSTVAQRIDGVAVLVLSAYRSSTWRRQECRHRSTLVPADRPQCWRHSGDGAPLLGVGGGGEGVREEASRISGPNIFAPVQPLCRRGGTAAVSPHDGSGRPARPCSGRLEEGRGDASAENSSRVKER